jgi:hypothetical protein
MIEMFQFPIQQTFDLIDSQIQEARKTGKVNLKYVFLVGGFSESPYMYRRIKEFVESMGLKTIRPPYAWSAVVRGAAAKALEGEDHPLIRHRKCRRHYGTLCHKMFVSGTHRIADSYICPYTGLKKADKQISWHLKKGQDLSTSNLPHASLSLHTTFWTHDKRTVEVILSATDKDKAPTRQNNVCHASLSVGKEC